MTNTNRRHFLLAGLALAAGLPPALRAQGVGMTTLGSPQPAPPLRLEDTEGRSIDLARYRGKVVLVNFWATWCPPCRKEIPSLRRLRKLFRPDEFEMIAVNVGEDPETVFDFIGAPDFPVVFDRDGRTMAAWPARGMPTTLLVDRQGRITHRAIGGREFDAPEIVATIRELLRTG